MVYAAAGEFSNTAILQKFTASETITKGDTCVVTPAAISTIAVSGAADASNNYPCVVATQAIANGETGMCVIYGEVSVTADGNCYKGAVVAAKSGKVAVAAAAATGLTGAFAKVTDGAADTGIATVFVGLVV